MPDVQTLLLFAGTATLLLLSPGPAVLYIVARSVEGGRVAGFVSYLAQLAGVAVLPRRLAGLTYIGLGVAAAFSGEGRR